MTRVCLVEEHHEVFYVWRRLLEDGLWDHASASVLHVDHHADMQLPTSVAALKIMNANPSDLLSVVRRDLTIETFLLAGAFCGLFKHIQWLSPHPIQLGKPQSRFIADSKNEAGSLVCGMYGQNVKEIVGETCRVFTFCDVETVPRSSGSPVLLDIDLDYFSCELFPKPAYSRVQITEAAAKEFQENAFHPFRLYFGPAARVIEEEGAYFFSIHEGVKQNAGTTRSLEEALREIDNFAGALKASVVQPSLVTIARSCLSGHTPRDLVQEIESHLLKALDDLYTIEVQYLEDI